MDKNQDSNKDGAESFDKEDEILSCFIDETVTEDEVSNIYSSDSKEESETLVPTFTVSSPYPFVVKPKGQSRTNLSKGKRPRSSYNTNVNLMLDSIDGDMLIGLETSKVNNTKLLYKLARESQHSEKIRRATHTLMLRIEEMHDKKILTLSYCVKVFMREYIPISISMSTLLSEHALSDILKIDYESSFVTLVSNSRELQETLRRKLFECKNLSVCCCGYVYVHPTLTYSKHPTDSSLLISKPPFTSTTEKMICIKKADVIKNLNALRYYLEILYEYYNN